MKPNVCPFNQSGVLMPGNARVFMLYNPKIQTTSPLPRKPITATPTHLTSKMYALEFPQMRDSEITHDASLPFSYHIYSTLCEANLRLLLMARMLSTDGTPADFALRLANDDLALCVVRSETTTVSPQELVLTR